MLYIAIILLVGLLFGRLATIIHLPSVTGYLIGGLIAGPSFFNGLTTEMLEHFGVVSEMALAFIAFTIGLSFKKSYFKRVGFKPVVIAFSEATFAVLIVTSGLLFIGLDPAFAIVLGAIAAATAPAATILVIKEFKAKGPVTDMLMSVVALDDAIALILFGFAATLAKTFMQVQGEFSVFFSILQPFLDIFLAAILGGLLGWAMKWPLKVFQSNGNQLGILIAFVFLSSGISSLMGISELLTTMMMGAILTNVSSVSNTIGDLADRLTPPLYLMFFVIAGAELNIAIIPSVGLVGSVYIVLRVVGKMLGTYVGAQVAHAPKEVSRYLGATLIPQAGVAIGLTSVAETLIPLYAPQIKAVVLVGTLVCAIVGPLATKIALTKAGEIDSPIKKTQSVHQSI